MWLDENEAEVNVAKIEKENKKKEAIALQITYRRAVHPDPTIFQKTVNKIPLDSSQLLQNLITIIQAADAETQVLQEASNSDRLQPKVFTKEQLLREKKKLDEKMIITEEKTDKKKRKRGESINMSHKKMRLEDGSMESIALVTSPEDLIGKRIRHQFELKNGDTKWYWGTIISKDKNKKNPVFEIKYDRHKKIYHLKDMMTDYQNEDLKLVPITPDDLIGKTIFHLHTDKDSKVIVGGKQLL